ncbi:hypothetical protein ACIBG7_12650 [Nonomuraea sp. NPDC050328]|uniref:hypothetical protein n=1 Tax=Nonomuraea sp. NPDC050328 TaxID=3364361 RepID=UPI0037ADBDF3
MTEIVEDFEDETYAIPFAGTWLRTDALSHLGTWCLRSGEITDTETSAATFEVPPWAKLVGFWYRTSTEARYDFLHVYVDGVLQFSASGEKGWERVRLLVAGRSEVSFRYQKDSSASNGLDAVFIDQLLFTDEAKIEQARQADLARPIEGRPLTIAYDWEFDDANSITPASLQLTGTGSDEEALAVWPFQFEFRLWLAPSFEHPLSISPGTVRLNTAHESDSAGSAERAQGGTLTPAAYPATAPPVRALKIRQLTPADETSTSRPLRSRPRLGRASDGATARSFSRIKVNLLGQALAAPRAIPLTAAVGGLLGTAQSSAAARPMPRVKRRVLAGVTETDPAGRFSLPTPPLWAAAPSRFWSASSPHT